MSVSYPEGETFFTRAGLATSQSDGYHAENAQHFHSHIMIEYIWNREADHGSVNANSPKGHWHLRSGYNISKGSNWGTHYGNYTQLPFSYGTGNPNIIFRRYEHNLCTSGNRFKAFEKGGSAEAWFMTMPMPNKNERWVWIDVCVNFALDTKKSIWCSLDGQNFVEHQFSPTYGLGVHPGHTIGFHIYGLIELLCLPRQFRIENAYNAKLIRKIPCGYISTQPVLNSYHDSYDFDWTKVSKANRGLDVMWKPPQSGTSWTENYFKNVLTIALEMIPGIGPILAMAFPLAWTAIRDPENFVDNLKNLVSGVELGMGIINEIKDSAKESRAYVLDSMLNSKSLPANVEEEIEGKRGIKSVEELGPSALFVEAAQNLGIQGEGESFVKKDEDEDGEVVSENPPKEDEDGVLKIKE